MFLPTVGQLDSVALPIHSLFIQNQSIRGVVGIFRSHHLRPGTIQYSEAVLDPFWWE